MLNAGPVLRTLPDLIAVPGASDVHVVRWDQNPHAGSSTADIDQRARRLAAGLRRREPRGARVLITTQPGPDFFAAFFGCMRAGLIPVPVPPARGGRRLVRTEGVVADCGATRLISTDESADVAAALGLRFDRLATLLDAVEAAPEPEPDDIAFLQFTSGSTDRPRGVMVTHATALANLAALAGKAGQPREGWMVSWLPLHHDMSLITALLAFFCGLSLAIDTPEQFTRRPWSWLEAISRRRARFSGAPNFAYELLNRTQPPAAGEPIDLSSWTTAFCAAEPVRPAVMRRFARRFASFGLPEHAITPAYGLAEFTLLATACRSSQSPSFRTVSETAAANAEVAGCGAPADGHYMLIVDPQTSRPLPDGVEGEIWLDGPSKAAGYWGAAEPSRLTFEARAQGSDRAWLRTGDLGLLADGELYVTGRLKELVILLGRNFHPHEIETAARASHPALDGAAAAFAVTGPDGEGLGIVCEMARDAIADLDANAIIAAVQRELIMVFGIRAVLIALVRPGSVPRTTSGKVQRLACPRLLETGGLRPLATYRDTAGPPSAEPTGTARGPAEIQTWLSGWLSRRFGLLPDSITPATLVGDLPLDSIAVISLTHALEDWLRVPLEETLLFNNPSLQALTVALAERVAGDPASPRFAPVHGPAAVAPVTPDLAMLLCRVSELSPAAVDLEFRKRILSESSK